MTGCFPSEENIKANCTCGCHRSNYIGDCLCNCQKYTRGYFNHTNVESTDYKNHKLIMERINKLESFKEMFIKEKIEDLMRLRKLESKFNELKDLVEKHLMEYEIYRNKYFCTSLSKPYKCPVCDGEGKKQVSNPFSLEQVSSDAVGRYFIKCKSCDGKGLLWR